MHSSGAGRKTLQPRCCRRAYYTVWWFSEGQQCEGPRAKNISTALWWRFLSRWSSPSDCELRCVGSEKNGCLSVVLLVLFVIVSLLLIFLVAIQDEKSEFGGIFGGAATLLDHTERCGHQGHRGAGDPLWCWPAVAFVNKSPSKIRSRLRHHGTGERDHRLADHRAHPFELGAVAVDRIANGRCCRSVVV